MNQHTPGPWKAHTDTGSPPFVTREGTASGWICQTVTWCGMDEAKANALLIAKAPELAADVKDAVETLRDFRDFVLRNATQWTVESSHHNPMWGRVAVVLDKHGENK